MKYFVIAEYNTKSQIRNYGTEGNNDQYHFLSAEETLEKAIAEARRVATQKFANGAIRIFIAETIRHVKPVVDVEIIKESRELLTEEKENANE